MKNVYTWAAKPARRTVTVGDLRAQKGKKIFTQVTANSEQEARAAEEAGFDMIAGSASKTAEVRKGSKNLFFTAALELHNYPTADDIMRGAFKALGEGADAVITPRSLDIVTMLAKEDVPVMGHLGLVLAHRNHASEWEQPAFNTQTMSRVKLCPTLSSSPKQPNRQLLSL